MLPRPTTDVEKTTLPGLVSFSVENEVYRARDPLNADDTDELYGPDYAGTFVVKYPSLRESLEIAARKTASIEAFGVQNVLQLERWAYELFAALTYLSVVAREKPPWVSIESDGTSKLAAAISHAARMAERLLDDGKKKSTGLPSSTGT